VISISIYAVVLLHENGLPICKRFLSGEERVLEPLVAAILGLAKEMQLEDITSARFGRSSMIIIRGVRKKSLILALLVEAADHLNHLNAVYLMNKIEKSIGDVSEIITGILIEAAERIFDSYLDKLVDLPDFVGESFEKASEKFGPLFFGSLIIILYRRFNEDPLNVLIRDPGEFIKTLDDILGERETELFFTYAFSSFFKQYSEIARTLGTTANELAKKIVTVARHKEEKASQFFRDLMEKIIDLILDKS